MRSILAVVLVLLFVSSVSADTFEWSCDTNCAWCSTDVVVLQSSDSSFHCLTYVVLVP